EEPGVGAGAPSPARGASAAALTGTATPCRAAAAAGRVAAPCRAAAPTLQGPAMLSALRVAQPEAEQLAVEGGSIDAELASGERLVAARRPQHDLDVTALHLLERHGLDGRRRVAPG